MAAFPSAGPAVSRGAYVGKVSALYALLFVDAVLNAVTDTSALTLEVVAFVTFLQVLCRFLAMMLIFLLATGTLLFRAGMLDVLLRQVGARESGAHHGSAPRAQAPTPGCWWPLQVPRASRAAPHLGADAHARARAPRPRPPQFGSVLAVSVLSLLLCLGTRLFRLVLLIDGVPVESYFGYEGYFGLYVSHNLLSALYYHLAVSAAFRLSDPLFYDAKAWRRS